jgi:hypothetical protein
VIGSALRPDFVAASPSLILAGTTLTLCEAAESIWEAIQPGSADTFATASTATGASDWRMGWLRGSTALDEKR